MHGSSWLVNIQADFGSAQNVQLFHGFFARTELLALAGVDYLVLVGRRRDRGETRSSFVAVRDFCSLPARPGSPLSNTSPSVHWKLVSYRFLALVLQQCCPFSEVVCKCSNALFCLSKSGIRDNGKWFVEG